MNSRALLNYQVTNVTPSSTNMHIRYLHALKNTLNPKYFKRIIAHATFKKFKYLPSVNFVGYGSRTMKVKVSPVARIYKVRIIGLDLPAPPLGEILQHVARRRSFYHAMNIVPWLTGSVFLIDVEAPLVEVVGVLRLQRGEK